MSAQNHKRGQFLTYSGLEQSSKFYTDNKASPLRITNTDYLQSMIGRDSKDGLLSDRQQKKSRNGKLKKAKSYRNGYHTERNDQPEAQY